MTLDDYLTEWERDAAFELTALDVAARQTPLLHAKWWRFYSQERLRLKKVDSDYKLLYRQKWEYFLGKMDDVEREHLGWPPQPLKILSQNVSVYLDGDADLQTLSKKRVYTEEVLRFLEDVIKQIHNRNYQLKTALDYLRFAQGEL